MNTPSITGAAVAPAASTTTAQNAWSTALGQFGSQTLPADVHMSMAAVDTVASPTPAMKALASLSRNVYDQPSPTAGLNPSPARWYKSQWFIQPMTALAVFLVCFILLIAIRPPFLYKKPPQDASKPDAVQDEPTFSTGGAAIFALCAMLVCIACMVTFALLRRKAQKTTGAVST